MSQTAYETNGSSNDTTASAKVVAKLSQVQSTMINSCKVCHKRVYDMEKIAIEQQLVFHKNCFRCSHCKGVLTVRNYTIVEDLLFCKQHYMRQFKEVGGKYNFTSVQTTSAHTPDKAALSIGVRGQGLSSEEQSTRSDKDFEPKRSNHDRVASPLKTQFDEGILSPNRVVTGAVAVSNMRSMFEVASNDKTPQTTTKPTFQRANSGAAYVEGEAAVISLMKNSSTVKSRMAQFSGASVSVDDQQEDKAENVSPISTIKVVEHKAHVRFADEDHEKVHRYVEEAQCDEDEEIHHHHHIVEEAHQCEEEEIHHHHRVEEAHQCDDEEEGNHRHEHEHRYDEEEETQDGVEHHEETHDGYAVQDGDYEENSGHHEDHDGDARNSENGYYHDNDEEDNSEHEEH